MKTDYKITSYYSSLQPDIEKFKVSLGGQTVSTFKTYELAARAIVKLTKDPWHYDRGYTRADRSNF